MSARWSQAHDAVYVEARDLLRAFVSSATVSRAASGAYVIETSDPSAEAHESDAVISAAFVAILRALPFAGLDVDVRRLAREEKIA
jgi:hypothetical protein